MTETLYLTIVAAYMARTFLDTTLFSLQWPEQFEGLLRILMCIVVLLKMTVPETRGLRRWLWYAAVFVAFRLSWTHTGYGFLLDTALLALGAAGIPYKKILKVSFWTGLVILLAAMLGSSSGCIPDLVYLDDGMFKHSFGTVYSTDFAAHVTYLFLTGWVIYGGRAAGMYALSALGLCAFVYRYSGAKCSTVVLLLSAVGVLYVPLTGRYRGIPSVAGMLVRRIDHVLIYAVPLCALVMVLLTVCYSPDTDVMVQADQLLSNRLRLGREAMDRYGVTLFGTPFPQQGFGGTAAWSWALEYNFIDCSYVLVLVRYGLVSLLAVCVNSVYMGKKALECGNRRLLLAAALVAVHSMIEHHLPEAAYNFFLLLPFAGYPAAMEGPRTSGKHPEAADRFVYAAFAVCFGAAVAAALPRAVAYLATIVDLQGLDLRENHVRFLLIAVGCVLWLGLLGSVLFRSAAALMRRALPSRAAMLGLTVLLLAFGGTFLRWELAIREGRDEYWELVEKDKTVIGMLLEKAPGSRLYVDHLTEVYRREFAGISDKAIPAEGLATEDDTTLVTEDSDELWALMAAGYEYGRLPSGHAVYTNSETHGLLLEESGVRMEGYYYRETIWPLQRIADWNGLSMTDTGGVLLAGQERSLLHGPGVTIYNGFLQVKFMLRMVTPPAAGSVVATAGMTSDWGKHIWEQVDLLLTDFDESGQCVYTLEHNLIFNCPSMEFTLTVQDGAELELQGVVYGKGEPPAD